MECSRFFFRSDTSSFSHAPKAWWHTPHAGRPAEATPDARTASTEHLEMTPASPRLSVITCTRDPRPDFFDRLLRALSAQTLSRDEWEYVVVDNGSRARPASLEELSWHSAARIVDEPHAGLTLARLRGIESTSSSLLVFLDDDNVPAASFLERVLDIAKEFPFLGAWGGSATGEFESTVPPWMSGRLRMLAVREVREELWSNMSHIADSMPNGAGLCVRREVAEAYARLHASGARPIMLDRAGDSLLSGGDEDLAACACDLGLGIGVFPRLELTHLISAARLEKRYLVRLAEDIAYSAVIRHWYHGRVALSPSRTFRSRVVERLRLAFMDGPSRALRQAEIRGRERALRELQLRAAEDATASSG